MVELATKETERYKKKVQKYLNLIFWLVFSLWILFGRFLFIYYMIKNNLLSI